MLITAVLLSYIFQFHYRLDYAISNSPERWGQLGDYIGGVLNPLLSFISIALLIQSLTLQAEANKGLRVEVELTRSTEKLRSFEMQLFNMLESQRVYFDSFKAHNKTTGAKFLGSSAVIKIEDTIEAMRAASPDPEIVTKYLERLDSTDKIYSLIRIFCNMTRVIEEKLSSSNGFSAEDRKSHYLTLINFTDFSLLRLIMLYVQFIDNASCHYLKSNNEFNAVLKEVGLGFELY